MLLLSSVTKSLGRESIECFYKCLTEQIIHSGFLNLCAYTCIEILDISLPLYFEKCCFT